MYISGKINSIKYGRVIIDGLEEVMLKRKE